MKNGFKISLFLIIILYLLLYFSYQNGYYVDKNKEKMLLTDEKIKEYEEDLKNGVDVSQKDYIAKVPSYDNPYTRFSLSLSRKIEKGFDKIIKYLFKKVGQSINE